jgi:hypothetical protein
MATALFTATGGEGTTYNNALVVELLVWPSEIEDAEKVQKVQEALEALQDDAGALLSREFPDAEHVYELVKKWGALNAELAGLASCQAEVVGWVPESGGSWLVGIVQLTLAQALESVDHYDVSELVGLWIAGFEVGAMDGGLIIGFLDAFDDKLDEAISQGDIATIQDVLVFAGQYGYPGLYGKAKNALVSP